MVLDTDTRIDTGEKEHCNGCNNTTDTTDLLSEPLKKRCNVDDFDSEPVANGEKHWDNDNNDEDDDDDHHHNNNKNNNDNVVPNEKVIKPRPLLKGRRGTSMDLEFHEHEDDPKDVPAGSYETAPLTEYGGDDDESSTGSLPEDDDSFCDADDDCEPNDAFLQAILVDVHPDRINLLDNMKPDSAKSNKSNTSKGSNGVVVASKKDSDAMATMAETTLSTTISTSIASTPTIEEVAEPMEEKPVSSSTSTNETVTKEQDKEEDHDDGTKHKEEEKDDFFAESADTATTLPRRSMLTSMGTSTKKSLRQMSRTFWAQPFKSLSRSLRRGTKGSFDS